MVNETVITSNTKIKLTSEFREIITYCLTKKLQKIGPSRKLWTLMEIQ